VDEYYSFDKKEHAYWANYLRLAEIADQGDKYRDLLVIEKWNWRIDGRYIYVEGKINNKGTRKIDRITIKALFYDNGQNVIDSDSTYISSTIDAKEMKSFELMHRMDTDIKTVSIQIDDFAFND
jgi:hypothetical protein